jgi:NADH-quinone oxidoreductase subunit N
MTQSDLNTILPNLLLVSWACVLLLVDLFIPKGRKGITALLSAAGFALALGVTLWQAGTEQVAFNGMLVRDGFSTFLNILFLASGLLGIALAYDYVKRMNIERGEYYVLMMFSVSGMMLMA